MVPSPPSFFRTRPKLTKLQPNPLNTSFHSVFSSLLSVFGFFSRYLTGGGSQSLACSSLSMILFVHLILRQSLMKQDDIRLLSAGRGWLPPRLWKLLAEGGLSLDASPPHLKPDVRTALGHSGFPLESGLGGFLKTPNVSPKNICHPPHLSLTGQ